MNKIVRTVLVLAVIFVLSSCVLGEGVYSSAGNADKQKALGEDKNGMTWYILDYGRDSNGILFAVSRKYYTNETIKNETIELLLSKYGVSAQVAENLYFTEYGYEYTSDGKQFAITHVNHYDIYGTLIHSTVYDGNTKDTQKIFSEIPENSTPAKGLSYALGEAGGNSGSSGGGGCESLSCIYSLALVGIFFAVKCMKQR